MYIRGLIPRNSDELAVPIEQKQEKRVHGYSEMSPSERRIRTVSCLCDNNPFRPSITMNIVHDWATILQDVLFDCNP